ncbi:MAG: four helix bundle protein [Bacilli bacterium]|nr:four helix bundle protein [Bacilli bacterium]
MNYNFNLLNNTKKTSAYINRLLINFPNKERVLIDSIEKNLYILVELIFSYNINTNQRIKEKYLKDIIVKLSMLDYYMNVSYEKKIISKKQYTSSSNFIVEIRKITYGILRNQKSD